MAMPNILAMDFPHFNPRVQIASVELHAAVAAHMRHDPLCDHMSQCRRCPPNIFSRRWHVQQAAFLLFLSCFEPLEDTLADSTAHPINPFVPPAGHPVCPSSPS